LQIPIAVDTNYVGISKITPVYAPTIAIEAPNLVINKNNVGIKFVSCPNGISRPLPTAAILNATKNKT
jgi:hypothetical protein